MKKQAVCLMALFLCLALASGLFAEAGPGRKAEAATKGTVTTDGLRVRKGAGTDKEILTYKKANVLLYKGAVVTIKSQVTVDKVVWYKISFSYEGTTLTGYVSSEYVKITEKDETSSGAGTGSGKETVISKNLSIPAKVTASNVNVRKGAATSYAQLTTVSGKKVTLEKNASVKIIKEVMNGSQKWYYISFTYNKKTKKGYILSDYAKLTLTRDISATIYGSASVKVRKGASKDKPYMKINNKTVLLKKGDSLTITKEVTAKDGVKWFKVDFTYNKKTRTGFIPANNVALKKVISLKGRVTTDGLRVRKGAGTNYEQVTVKGVKVTLSKGQVVTIKAQTKVGDVTWYKVSFQYNGETVTGYVSGEYLVIVGSPSDTADSDEPDSPDNDGSSEDNSGPAEEPDEDGKEDEDEKGDEDQDDSQGEDPDDIITDVDGYLDEQGFPESYQEGLAALLKAHPTWQFKAYKTGLSWDEAIEKESKVGLNLISNNKANGWKSYESGAYNYVTDKFVVFDGSTWVTASKEAIAYYMDPRNFMTERGIFQFLTLEYQSKYENQKGVENILANTPLANKEYGYLDEDSVEEVTKLYSETFIEAAKKSGVSPYHLATRVKQEVVTNSTTLSGSANGSFAGYEGYYNFYNIGATHSTAAGGAIANGLNFAMGNKSSANEKATYLLPWNNQYKAIVGGAIFIGKQYINRGQDTIYLQKFNVTDTSTYSHQYMANVEAANSEAIKLYNGYSNVMDAPLVFYIPIFEDMPKEKCGTPGAVKSPNNWLKSLSVGNYSLTPKFKAESGSSQEYALSLEDEPIDSVDISAVAASSSASIEIQVTVDGSTQAVSKNGKGTLELAAGENIVEIVVTAENGEANTYKITISK